MNEHLNQILTLLLGAAGFWNIAELFIRLRSNRQIKRALAQHLKAQQEAKNSSLGNFGAEKLEDSLLKLEAETELMHQALLEQSNKIQTIGEQLTVQSTLLTECHHQMHSLTSKTRRDEQENSSKNALGHG